MAAMNLESYPPVFRQQSTSPEVQAHSHSDDVAKEFIQEFHSIPVVDLQCLNLDKLAEACKNWGLFRLVNHGIPLTLLRQLQDHSKKIFSLSFESKKALVISSPMSYFWGTPALTPSGDSLSRGSQNINWVEGFNVPVSQLSQFQARDPTLDSFRILLEEYGRHLTRIATTIFDAMAKTLNLNPEQSKTYLSESTGSIRVYRYPRCSSANETFGMEAHTDSSVLSILNQEQVGGFELLKDDKWLQIEPIPETLVLNLGDMLQAISNDEYKSVKHRVKPNKYGERYSICYFVFPSEGSVIQSSKYKPFTYNDFRAQVQQDIRTMGFKVGLDRFKFKQSQLQAETSNGEDEGV
ncbi:gibberellin 2-beta-dioxygenase 8 isoform X1 [Manihot esculenta]|uniref:gibberellin 2-beta-dioxygenase 8 isoform X1 n=1 Tax=Manihot esculenta TaxID=3983 RepID=UPI000B5D1A04|nr:gibberellin 2-beta-dioxygenase 8 isoform X1 [Manihot esculenta]